MCKKYKLLQGLDLIDYVYEKGYLAGEKSQLEIKEVSDGNINHVHIVKNFRGQSICIKQGDVLLRSSGRPLSQDRTRIEALALKRYEKYDRDRAPKIYDYDKDMNIIVMENISGYKNMRLALMEKGKYPFFPGTIVDFILKTSMPSSYLYMDAEERKNLEGDFINPEMCKISEDLVFTEPYVDYKSRNIISPGLENFVEREIYGDRSLKFEVGKLKEKFMEKRQMLIHGDLHMGSIFIQEDGFKVLDPEFAFFGPLAYDTGNILGNLFFSIAYSEFHLQDQEYSSYLKDLAHEYMEELEKRLENYLIKNEPIDKIFRELRFRKYLINEILSDTLGYAGTEILRRTIGDSKVLELENIADPKTRKLIDKILIRLSKEMIINRKNIKKVEEVLDLYKSINI